MGVGGRQTAQPPGRMPVGEEPPWPDLSVLPRRWVVERACAWMGREEEEPRLRAPNANEWAADLRDDDPLDTPTTGQRGGVKASQALSK